VKSVREREALERYLEQLEQSDEQDEVVIDPSAVADALEKLRQHREPEVGFMRTTQGFLPAYNVQVAVDAEHALIVVQQVTVQAGDNGSLQPMAEAAQAATGGPAQPINVVADAGYSNGEQAEACEAKGILPHVPANRGVNSRGDGTLFDRTEFTYQPESDTFLCPAGQTLARKQLMRKDRTVLYAAQPEVCGACPLKIAMHRVAATDSYSSPARRGATAHATTGHAGGDAAATSHRGTSIRQFEIPHLRTSTIPAAWTARSANGNQSGRSRLQSETHGEYSRRTQATCSSAGHLILLLPVITRRQRTFASPKQKSDAPALGTSLWIAFSLSFRNSLHCQRLSIAYTTAWYRGPKRADRTEHRPEEKRRQDTTDCLSQNVTRHSVPREIAPNRERQGDCRVQMGSAHCAHEIDDSHYHKSGRNHHHARSYGPAASSSDDFATGCNHDQQERAPGFREDSPPLKRAV